MAPRALGHARVQNAAASMFGQLSADYRGGAFGAGDRVPDVNGLYDELDLGALTLFTDDASALAVARRWRGVVTVRDGRADGWMLVRPDGYLADRGEAGAVAALERLLDQWFILVPAERQASERPASQLRHQRVIDNLSCRGQL